MGDDPTWPYRSFNPDDWADVFCEVAKRNGHDLDREWVSEWIWNAMMRGYDRGRSVAFEEGTITAIAAQVRRTPPDA